MESKRVYVVAKIDGYGPEVMGVYSTMEAAVMCAMDCTRGSGATYDVQEFDVDKEADE